MTCTALPLLDLIESTRRRDEALATVSENSGDWMKLALIALEELAKNPTGWANLEQGFLGEDIRRMVVPLCGHPHHNNAFGALIRMAIGRNIIVPTGEYRAMKAVNSHSRKTPVYVFGKLS